MHSHFKEMVLVMGAHYQYPLHGFPDYSMQRWRSVTIGDSLAKVTVFTGKISMKTSALGIY
jgi:hypothetical protein